MFLPLFSKVVTNILKIYELPKIYKILKKLFTIIIYQVNSTVKPVYNDHLWDKVSVVVIERWSL